jgi:biopolymer transport protein ExbD
MRIPSSHSRRTPIDLQSAMTPLIDVVFQLLIFFICASTGHLRELLLPTDFAAGAIGDKAPQQIEKPLGEVRIRLRREVDATIFKVEGTEFTDLVNLTAMLRGLAETAIDIPVILEIDPDVPLGDAVSVYDACRAAKFRTINFAADASQLKRPMGGGK